MTSSGIEPATFWLVAQCLNQIANRQGKRKMSRKVWDYSLQMRKVDLNFMYQDASP
jgi:hypothetical protein